MDFSCSHGQVHTLCSLGTSMELGIEKPYNNCKGKIHKKRDGVKLYIMKIFPKTFFNENIAKYIYVR